ncbi:MAG: hypothetical protein FWE41_05820 [Coriobacteriia bacterium]|nr:hypothetical protein [Coriobacteriia bacterium]
MFQFDQGQIGTLTPSPCSTPVPIWDTNPVPLFQSGTPTPSPCSNVKTSFRA